jgi:hypothetical protein
MIRWRLVCSSDRGAVLVIVAVWMTSALALTMFVVDLGHWFVHKRHLQMQTDAGAFAGGSLFNKCGAATGAERANPSSAANVAVENQARMFSGDTKTFAAAHNPQVSNRPNVTILLNSSKFANESGATNNSDPAGPPCQAGFLDVKATDANLSWFFADKLVPAINARARVSIFKLGTLAGSLPLAVEDVNPLAAGAIVVDEDVPNFKTVAAGVLGRQILTAGSAQTLNGQSLTPWTGAAIPATIAHAHNGVVIALCSNAKLCGPTKGSAWLNGTVNDVCTQLFVTCVAGNQTGVEFIHGYSTSGTGSSTVPLLRDVTLTKALGAPSACADDSAPYFLLNGNCKVGVDAIVNFGVTGDPSKPDTQGGVKATVAVGTCNLSYTGSSGTNSTWRAGNCQTIANGGGQVPLALSWTTSTGSGKTKVDSSGSFTQVARPFANDGPADTQSYPIAYAQISQGSDCLGGLANSLPFGDRLICVGVGVLGNLKVAAAANDPTKLLKFNNGSHTGAVDCGGQNLRDMIQFGCTTSVQPNPGEACPNTTLPADCLPIMTGTKRGQEFQGMNNRWAPNGTCLPNNWGSFPNIPQNDPRVVPLIITLSGAFAGSGSGDVPVMDFAAFYITGWSKADNACNGINEAEPASAKGDVADIWGHFITYVGDLGTSTGTVTCDFTGLTPCIPMLTK